MSIAAELADYADSLSIDDIDDRTIEAAKVRLLDSLVCAVAALDEPPVARTRAHALETTGPTAATVVGTTTSVSTEYAAMANGAAVRYLDWNDTGISSEIGCGHPSDNVATVLAAAEAYGRSGSALLRAMVTAYEVHIRLCDAMPLRRHGWDHVIYELVAGALGAGTLAGLDRDELAQAVNIALAGHLGTYQSRTGDLSDWKALAAANASRNALVAVALAGRGITGPNGMFEGRHGILRQLVGDPDLEIDVGAFGGDGTPFRLPTTYMKVNPIETHSQAAVECAQQLVSEHDLRAEEIESITCETYGDAVGEIGDDAKWDPQTRETADHSLPYILARTILDGDVGPGSFTPEKIADPAVRDLLGTVSVEENPAFTERYGEAMPHRLTVVTDRGTFQASVDYPKGHERRPFTFEDVREKFRVAAGDRLEAGERDAAEAFVRSIEDRPTFEPLFEALTVGN